MKESTNPMVSNIDPEDRLYRILFWMLVAGSFLIFFWDIWSIPLLTHNEARRLVVLREMMTNHQWLIPYMNGVIYLEKPPLFYWFGAIFGLPAHSTSEWVLRLPSGICAMGLVWMLFFSLKEYVGRWAALFSVLVLVTSEFFTLQARLAELEMLLTFCVFSALLFYFNFIQHGNRCRLYGAYAMLGLAFLTKGPVALLFFLPPILCYGVPSSGRHALKGLIDWRGWLLFSIIAFPWFIYINMYLQGAPLLRVITGEISSTVDMGKMEPFYFYLNAVAKGFAPWILVLLWQPHKQYKKLFAADTGRFFFWAALVPLILFSLFTTKRDKYMLPLYPALAVWLGMALANAFEQVKLRRRSVTIALIAFSALLIAGYIGYYSTVQARVMSYRYEAFRTLAARLDSLRGKHPVYFFRMEAIQLVYFYGQPIPVVHKEALEKMLADGQPFLLLAKAKYAGGLKDAGVCQLEYIKNFEDNDKGLYIFGGGSLCQSSAIHTPSSAFP